MKTFLYIFDIFVLNYPCLSRYKTEQDIFFFFENKTERKRKSFQINRCLIFKTKKN